MNLSGPEGPFNAFIDPSITIDPRFTTPGYTVLSSPNLGPPPPPPGWCPHLQAAAPISKHKPRAQIFRRDFMAFIISQSKPYTNRILRDRGLCGMGLYCGSPLVSISSAGL